MLRRHISALCVLLVVTSSRPSDGCGQPQFERRGYNRTKWNGTPGLADPSLWPWMVLLEVWDIHTLRYRFHCGGTLIDHQHVLTAAHCMDAATETSDLIATRFDRRYPREIFVRVSLGVYHRIQDKPMHARLFKIYLHPLYRVGELHHDIAILRLHKPVRYSPRIQPICLPDRDTGDLRNQSLSEAGWFSSGGWSDSLRSVDLRMVEMDACQKRYANISQLLADGLRDFKLCAIPARVGLAKSCNGVSGDPMVAVKHDHRRRVLVGIVSAGKGCGSKEYPGIYTRVSSYLGWIRKVTKATSKKS